MSATPEVNQSRGLERLILERDLLDRRVLSLETGDGTLILFRLKSLSDAKKVEITARYDRLFPMPPVKTTPSPVGNLVSFDLENAGYKEQLLQWQTKLGMAFLAETLGVPLECVEQIDSTFPQNVVSELQTTVQLINGTHSEPLMNLVREAMWAPEVLTWIETYKPDDPDFTITDTSLFHEMEVIVASGHTRESWQKLSARDRIIYMAWHDAKSAKEAYSNWYITNKDKKKPGMQPLRPGSGPADKRGRQGGTSP